MRLGIGWYTAETYAALCAVADDRDTLPATHAEWERKARKILFTLRGQGMDPEQYFVNVEELVRWCKDRGLPLTGEHRARFVSEQVQAAPVIRELKF